MEEKERYKLESYHEAFCEIHDTEADEWYVRKDLVTDLLNQQDKRIKELEKEIVELKRKYELSNFPIGGLVDTARKLEEENQQLKDQVKKSYQESLLQKQFDKDMEIQELKDKIEQLEQSQKQLAIEQLEKVKADINTYNKEHCFLFPEIDTCNKLIEIIDNQIKELGGGENE